MKNPDDIICHLRDDNLRLTAENLRLRTQRMKLRRAFAMFVNKAFVKSKHRENGAMK